MGSWLWSHGGGVFLDRSCESLVRSCRNPKYEGIGDWSLKFTPDLQQSLSKNNWVKCFYWLFGIHWLLPQVSQSHSSHPSEANFSPDFSKVFAPVSLDWQVQEKLMSFVCSLYRDECDEFHALYMSELKQKVDVNVFLIVFFQVLPQRAWKILHSHNLWVRFLFLRFSHQLASNYIICVLSKLMGWKVVSYCEFLITRVLNRPSYELIGIRISCSNFDDFSIVCFLLFLSLFKKKNF